MDGKRIRAEIIKPIENSKTAFSQEFPVLPHPSSPHPFFQGVMLPGFSPISLVSIWKDKSVRVNGEVKIMQWERERKQRKGPKNSQSE